MSKDELIVRLVFENVNLRDENDRLKRRLSKSIPVSKEYQIGDLAAILKNVVEGNSKC